MRQEVLYRKKHSSFYTTKKLPRPNKDEEARGTTLIHNTNVLCSLSAITGLPVFSYTFIIALRLDAFGKSAQKLPSDNRLVRRLPAYHLLSLNNDLSYSSFSSLLFHI